METWGLSGCVRHFTALPMPKGGLSWSAVCGVNGAPDALQSMQWGGFRASGASWLAQPAFTAFDLVPQDPEPSAEGTNGLTALGSV